ncbi:hypothetical protein [Hymenobacter koreensis]|uniref:Uncharacterized protein n=1 Tax=Hymenobacter koreensis TaxID=1084523 RepID=A0ABP8IXK8_9BACT
MPDTNVPKTPKHDDPARKKEEDKRPATNERNKPTPDKAHDPQRSA